MHLTKSNMIAEEHDYCTQFWDHIGMTLSFHPSVHISHKHNVFLLKGQTNNDNTLHTCSI